MTVTCSPYELVGLPAARHERLLHVTAPPSFVVAASVLLERGSYRERTHGIEEGGRGRLAALQHLSHRELCAAFTSFATTGTGSASAVGKASKTTWPSFPRKEG